MEQEMVAKKLNGTVDIKCSNQEDEIKGACEDFLGVMINDQRKCLKLTESNNTKTCCGLNVKMDMFYHLIFVWHFLLIKNKEIIL